MESGGQRGMSGGLKNVDSIDYFVSDLRADRAAETQMIGVEMPCRVKIPRLFR